MYKRQVGIKLFADGVLVVDVSELEDGRSPALQCGIQMCIRDSCW